MIALVCVRSLTLARVSTVRMEPHRANTFDLHTVALKNTTAALANAQQQLSNLAALSGGGVLGVWNTASSSGHIVMAPRYARDAVGRVVVEDGLVRMQPHGSGLTDALKGATSALANAHQQLSYLAALSGGDVLGVWNTASSSVSSITAPRYTRDALGRVVVEDGLVRMQPHGRSLRTDALKGATSALANAQQQLSNLAALSGGGVLGVWNTVSSSLVIVTAPRYARDAVGRVVVEDGLVRMQPHGSGLHTETLKGATSALANAQQQLSNLAALSGGGVLRMGGTT